MSDERKNVAAVQRQKIVVIAGGGVYGLIPCVFLKSIDQKDILKIGAFGGTSIGGILALHLSVNASPDKLYDDFTSNVNRFFQGSIFRRLNPFLTKYSADGVESALQDIFHENVRDCLGKFVVPSLNFKTISPMVFNNFGNEFDHMPIWKIARATSAAPMYFPPFSENILLDGGVLENLPIITTASIVCKYLKITPLDIDLFAIGTGMIDKDMSRTNSKVSHYSPIDWAKNLMPVLTTGGNEMMSELWGKNMGFHYFHYFNPVPIDGVMDNVKALPTIIEKCELYKGKFVKKWNDFMKA